MINLLINQLADIKFHYSCDNLHTGICNSQKEFCKSVRQFSLTSLHTLSFYMRRLKQNHIFLQDQHRLKNKELPKYFLQENYRKSGR